MTGTLGEKGKRTQSYLSSFKELFIQMKYTEVKTYHYRQQSMEFYLVEGGQLKEVEIKFVHQLRDGGPMHYLDPTSTLKRAGYPTPKASKSYHF